MKTHNKENKRTFKVRRHKIQEELQWLKQNNSLHKIIAISNSQL